MHFRHCQEIHCVQIPLSHSIFGLRSSEKFYNVVYLVIVYILHFNLHSSGDQDTSFSFSTVHHVAPIGDISKSDKGIVTTPFPMRGDYIFYVVNMVQLCRR